MINQRNKNTFYFNELLNDVSLKEVQSSTISFIQFENLKKVWIAFINHIFDQMKLNRRVKIFDFFIIGFAANKKNIQIEFTKNWLKRNELTQMILEKPPIIPIKKMFFENILQYTDLTLEEISLSIRNIFAYMEDLILNSADNVEIELQYLGRIIKLGNIINFIETPQIQQENKNFESNTYNFLMIHKGIINMDRVKGEKFNSTKINQLPIKKLAPLKSFLCLDFDKNLNSKQKNLLKSKKVKINSKSIIKKLKPLQKTELATHPLSLNQNFSNLINNPKDLFNSVLKKPPLFKQPAPLLFDPYSHTKACPLNLQYNSFSISSRIAINYTPLSKYLYLDYETQKILVLYNKENKALFLRQAPESNQEDQKTPEELSKDRYEQYINEFISDRQTIQFPQKSFDKILDQDYNKYKYLLPQDIKEKKENLKQEIKKDFNMAVKKVLLDYVLKEEEEKIRLGIQKVIDPIVEYGQDKYKFQMTYIPNTFQQRKTLLDKNLILYQETTHKIVDCWFYIKENNNFVLDSFKEKAVTLKDFQDIQKEQMSNLRQSLCSVWVKEISQIYKKNLLNQSKKQIRKYFDCISNVISQQVRELVINSIQYYLNFMKKYEKESYLSVEECLLENQNLIEPLQKSFLILQLKEANGKIVFENNLDYVKEQILQVLKDGVTNSDNIPRPENFFYRSDKNILHIIGLDDEIVVNAVQEIQNILELNFEQISRVNSIFEQFEHLFKEGDILNDFLLNKEPNIQSYLQFYKKYNLMKDKIVEQIPQTIYMNFARIDCTNLKRRFIEIVENLNKKIIDRAQEEITQLTQQIDLTRKKSLNDVSVQIDTVEKLIKAEYNLEEYQEVKFIFIKENFEKIIDWYRNFYIGTSRLNSNVYADIQSTIDKIQTMDQEIKKETKRIKSERERLEKNNRSDKEIIGNLLKICKNNIEEFKTKGKKYEMNNLIPKITNIIGNYQQGEKKIIVINKEEELLGFSISSFQEFKEVGNTLKIFEDLWKMIEDWEEKKKNWESSDIFSLNPEFMKKDIEDKLNKIEQILKNFNEMDPIPEPPIHLTEEIQRAIINFKEDVILLEALCTKGMEKRHWDQVNQLLSDNKINLIIDTTNSYVIKTIRDSGIKSYTNDIQGISIFAHKEYQNKLLLNKIEEELQSKMIDLKPYIIRDSYVITQGQVNDIQKMFKNHYEKINNMQSQKESLIHQDRIIKLNSKIQRVESTLNHWLIVQTLWIHLEPIFTTEEYLEYLPEQYQQFAQANQGYLKFMKERKENRNIINLGEYRNYMNKLQILKKQLKIIHRKLEAFIYRQNMPFPKFYSVSINSNIEIEFIEDQQEKKQDKKQKQIVSKCKSFNN